MSLDMFRLFGDQSRSDDGGDAVMNLGQRIVFCFTVDKYFHLLLIAFKTISVVHLTYLDLYRQFTLNVTLRRFRIILLPWQNSKYCISADSQSN